LERAILTSKIAYTITARIRGQLRKHMCHTPVRHYQKRCLNCMFQIFSTIGGDFVQGGILSWIEVYTVKRGFHPTQRTKRTQRRERKGRNEMTSLLDRPTADGNGQSQPPATTAYAAGTQPSCGRHAIKYEIIKNIKLNLICIINFTTSKKPSKIWTIDFFKP